MQRQEHEMKHISYPTIDSPNPWDDAEEWEQDAHTTSMPMESTQVGGATRASNREVVRLVRRIQALTLEIRKLDQDGTNDPEFAAKERALEQLRWRLAVAARRDAHHDFGAAA
jgi:hypothetical protein